MIDDQDNFYEDDDGYYGEYDEPIDGVGFANPGGPSALRAETPENPRIYPCPTCGAEWSGPIKRCSAG